MFKNHNTVSPKIGSLGEQRRQRKSQWFIELLLCARHCLSPLHALLFIFKTQLQYSHYHPHFKYEEIDSKQVKSLMLVQRTSKGQSLH